jgi:hypothetical protein
MVRGLTGTQPYGGAMVGTGAEGSAITLAAIGILAEKHTYALQGSALAAGAAHSAVISGATGAAWFSPMGGNPDIFPSRQIEIVAGGTMCRIKYDLTGTAATSSSGTTVTIGSSEDDIDTSFAYIPAGGTSAAIGSLRFISASAAGSFTTAVTFGAGNAIGTDNVCVIRPLLHYLFVTTVGNTTTSTNVSSVATIGLARMVQLERHILRNGADEMLDPYTHGSLTSLNGLSQFELYGVFCLQGTIFAPIQ